VTMVAVSAGAVIAVSLAVSSTCVVSLVRPQLRIDSVARPKIGRERLVTVRFSLKQSVVKYESNSNRHECATATGPDDLLSWAEGDLPRACAELSRLYDFENDH
jgi:hypothetical protein